MFLVSFYIGAQTGSGLFNDRHLIVSRCEQQLRTRHCSAVAVYGINAGAAFAAVLGPSVEVPALIGLVNVALNFQSRYFKQPVAARIAGSLQDTDNPSDCGGRGRERALSEESIALVTTLQESPLETSGHVV